jgi:hypothetical protein
MRDPDIFGMPICPEFVRGNDSEVPAAPYHGLGQTGPQGEQAVPGAEREPGPNARALCLYDTVFTEQRLDVYSRNSRSRGPYAALHLPANMFSGPPTCDYRRVRFQGNVVLFYNGRNIYERANNCFRASGTPQQDYLIEYVTPAPQRVWWCSQSRFKRYMATAASIFFSRLNDMVTSAWGPATARAWGPQLDFGWRRDIIHQFHGSHIMVRDAASTISLTTTQASTLFENAFRRARRQMIIQSAVMAAEASLLNSKRRQSSTAYRAELRELLAQSQNESLQIAFERYLDVTLGEEAYQQSVQPDPLLNTNT